MRLNRALSIDVMRLSVMAASWTRLQKRERREEEGGKGIDGKRLVLGFSATAELGDGRNLFPGI